MFLFYRNLWVKLVETVRIWLLQKLNWGFGSWKQMTPCFPAYVTEKVTNEQPPPPRPGRSIATAPAPGKSDRDGGQREQPVKTLAGWLNLTSRRFWIVIVLPERKRGTHGPCLLLSSPVTKPRAAGMMTSLLGYQLNPRPKQTATRTKSWNALNYWQLLHSGHFLLNPASSCFSLNINIKNSANTQFTLTQIIRKQTDDRMLKANANLKAKHNR